jgi:hypothetical protein
MTGLHSLRSRLAVLAGRVPVPPSAWPAVVFDIVETGPTGPVVTGRVVRDMATPAGWREIPPDTHNERTCP